MDRILVMLCIVILTCVFSSVQAVKPGPVHPATRGEVWPSPLLENKQTQFYTFNPSLFTVEVTEHNCTLLLRGIQRYVYLIKQLNGIARRYRRRAMGSRKRRLLCSRGRCEGIQGMGIGGPEPNYRGALRSLRVTLKAPCEAIPYLDMDESYELEVSGAVGEAGAATLVTNSVWGALRGLETFAQLFYLSDDYTEVRINATMIEDGPRYAHRGLLLDVSRHYLSVHTIHRALDAMAADKLNVLHLHLTDDQSFPYRSDALPELSKSGAYHPTLVYTRSDIEGIIEYATERGIRVLPEIDVPGHTRSWGVSHPEVLTECGKSDELGPLHPLRNSTYDLLQTLLREASRRFPDQYLHLGGDEVDLSCWGSNPELREYMLRHNMTNPRELLAVFFNRTFPLLKAGVKPIVWQEVFDEGVPLPRDMIVQVWRDGATKMRDLIMAGQRVLYSTAWYLDHLQDSLDTFLSVDPRRDVIPIVGEELAKRVIGGEAAMWGEMADDTNVLARIWPRVSGVAERLWSLPEKAGTRVHTLSRAEEHTCRLRRRGYPAQPPSGPGFCIT